ncbi:alpha/beta fold hydrolase [Pseudoalteromonas sp. T1lg10]|uniref:alpha/beta fold hydrolase n=1 Tax=Pseudoalteromonas sp. T1lg10 TaxID=2077093 RepID=UPI000CF64484|nr:alpha/beta hydrolase [Pseudoalteromonas sp. T1lg10]
MTKFSAILLLLISLSLNAKVAYVALGDYRVEYELRGDSKATLLLEAGGSAGLEDWNPIYDRLTSEYRTLRYSRIGNGGSTAVRKNYSSEEYADEALALLDALNIDGPVIYIAHSYGAYIARTFAARYPEKVAALMLIEPASEHDVDIMRQIDLAKAEQEIAEVKRDDMKNGMSNQYLDFWAKRPLPDHPEIADIPVTVIASIKRYENPPLLFYTDKARVMWGELHRDWALAFPQGKIVLTDKSYHFPQRDEPEMVLEEIKALVQRTTKSK